ncbi:hypothetical protein [Lacticaseibacillus absianus]|uniref:hypothetical protein n=1 Tax=Lacticaseibacillus absianus TaxID=2729623 RepID=UPI0015C99779|nr:hypothetical protein [Lacticaseibacillus absianus]
MTKIKVPGLKPGDYGTQHFAIDKAGELAIVGDQARPAILKRYRLELTDDEIRRHGLTALRETGTTFCEEGDHFKSSGADLLREAVVDWQAYAPDQPFDDYFWESRYITANKTYEFTDQLKIIREVNDDGK